MGLRNIDPRNDGQDSYLYQPDSDPKKVSFTLASGSLTGRNYGAGARAASPPSRDGAGHQLTAAETELPWKRPDSHPAVPAWRSANPDLDEDDDEDEDDGEKILRMSAASSSAASSNEDTYRNQHEKVDEVKIDIHAVP
uniref:Uncharacterized protein n=1 Tax=Plectus sambesii TaxID=2011161 RepID=A0A914XKU9_9BILA